MEKLLSIIIPTYNMEKYLRKCLDSLLVSDDNLKQLEVIVVNDGSKDSSSEIAHEYESRFPETFRVIDKENGNYGSCINRGLKEATGKYIKVLDADDWFDDKAFNLFITFLKDCTAECILTDFIHVTSLGKVLCDDKIGLPEGVHNLKDLPENVVMRLWMHQVTYKVENLRSIGYTQTEGISYTDQEWIFLPLSSCRNWQYYPVTLYNYLVGRDGQTMQSNVVEKNLWMTIKGVYVMLDEFEKLYPGCSVEGKVYLDHRLKARILSLYSICYFQIKTKKYDDELRKLDSWLLIHNPAISNWLNKVKYAYIFPYLKMYRKQYKRNCFVMWIHNFKNKVQNLFNN